MDFSCALDGSRESVKCQVKSAELRELRCGEQTLSYKSSPKSQPLLRTMLLSLLLFSFEFCVVLNLIIFHLVTSVVI